MGDYITFYHGKAQHRGQEAAPALNGSTCRSTALSGAMIRDKHHGQHCKNRHKEIVSPLNGSTCRSAALRHDGL